MHYLATCIIVSWIGSNLASVILSKSKMASENDGFLELKPDGSLIWRGGGGGADLNNSSSVWQEVILFKAILKALRSMPVQTTHALKDLNHKIYGEGVEHKFPPFLERIIQRIQTYFSVYKYTDSSLPVREEKESTTTSRPLSTATSSVANETLNETLTLSQNEIDVNVTATTTTTTRVPTTVGQQEDEENEFIEVEN